MIIRVNTTVLSMNFLTDFTLISNTFSYYLERFTYILNSVLSSRIL